MSTFGFGYFNGEWIDPNRPHLLLSDIGLLRGYGIFEFFHVLGGKPVFGEDHLDRFFRSARKMHLEVPLHREELIRVLAELLDKNGEPDASLRLVLTGGYSENAYLPAAPNLIILQQKYQELPAETYDRGVGLMTTAFKRELPGIKTTNYMNGIRLLPKLKRLEAFEPLYHDHGFVRESVRSNIFIIDRKGTLATPDKHILPGITRQKVLEIGQAERQVEIRAVRLKELDEASEIFITGTFKQVLPIVHIDGKKVGAGRPGPVSLELRDRFLKKRNAD
jgi:branched-subunit amino acid aminotransferase/4-amino-4-deoxychorismate lyase